MNDKAITLVVSDLHVGGGAADPGDDHVYDRQQFAEFVREQGRTAEGGRGDVELIINGDFLEFAQVLPESYSLASSDYWTSQRESLLKLRVMLAGHPELFSALGDFQRQGNRVTIAAGNHDVDFYWEGVREELRAAAGPVGFELGSTWFHRYDGKFQIGHGHQFDPANAFRHWERPILDGPDGVERLEMCPGTIFMVKFVNWLEKDYPFSDNIKPVTALGRILWKENRYAMAAVAWVLTQFLTRYPRAAMNVDEVDRKVAPRLLQMIRHKPEFREKVAALYRAARDPNATADDMPQHLSSEKALLDFLFDVFARVDSEVWMDVLDVPGAATLGVGGDPQTLYIIRAQMSKDKEVLAETAAAEMRRPGGPQVVTMGHTHQPDHVRTEHGVYYNTGSWTRYADIGQMDTLTLEDLKREADYPYQLNFVRVWPGDGGALRSEMVCYAEERPRL